MLGVFVARCSSGELTAFAGPVASYREITTTGFYRLTDEEWERLREKTKAADDSTLETLKARFQEGIPLSWGEVERADAAALYGLMAKLGGEELVGSSPVLVEGTFWPNVAY